MTVAIRIATQADGPAVAALYAPYVLGPGVSFELVPPDAETMAERIAATLPRHPWLVATRGGVPVAYAYGSVYGSRPAYGWTVETAIYVAASERGRGVGRVLYPALLDILRTQGYRSALARLALPNPGSEALHRAVGFVPVGVHPDAGYKHGRWHPIAYWYCALNDADPPHEVVPYGLLPQSGYPSPPVPDRN